VEEKAEKEETAEEAAGAQSESNAVAREPIGRLVATKRVTVSAGARFSSRRRSHETDSATPSIKGGATPSSNREAEASGLGVSAAESEESKERPLGTRAAAPLATAEGGVRPSPPPAPPRESGARTCTAPYTLGMRTGLN